ncbi:hypothetical protein FEM03_00560 [Phragmitibacter flavus]|uniref:Galactose oxidase n=1 Tax=Phragmitibacter flavus TaxID=2576071 RepID=A0A5R8KJY5_9BACT|nr:kelch repeat-containing protein [Phragmitibacter flavus]TLD72602.1 hypothetical protein FEM03_00560 [Phragmitibacter flavus]
MRFTLLTLLFAPALHAIEIPALSEPVTSFGAAVTEGYLYTYGGHMAESHSWSLPTTSGALQRINLKEPGKWEALSSGPQVQSPGVAAADGKVYLIGGMQPQNGQGEDPVLKSLDHALVFDTKTSQWSELPKLPEPRSSHDVAILNNKLYVVGGWPLNTAKDSADEAPDDRHAERAFHDKGLVLDLANPGAGWQSFEQPFQRRAIALVALAGKLYVLGGMDAENKVSAEADVYDIASKTWSKLPEMPVEGRTKGFATAACEVDGELIASPRGGKIFALRNDTWQEAGKLEQSRYFHQLEPLDDGRVIALGGTSGDEPLDDVEVAKIKK